MAKKDRRKGDENPFYHNRHEIYYQLINSVMAGGLVVFGSMSDGEMSWKGLVMAAMAAGFIFLTKFREYWDEQAKEYQTSYLNFI